MTALLAELIAFVVAFTGLPPPERPPAVVMVPREFFVQTICHGAERCDVQGWVPGEDTAAEFPGVVPYAVYIDSRHGAALALAEQATRAGGSLDAAGLDVESAYAAGLLVHELTHYMQHISGAFGRSLVADCVTRIRTETQAVIVQAAWLARRGLPFDARAAASMYRCADG